MRVTAIVKKVDSAKPKTASLAEVHSEDLLLQGVAHQDGKGRVGFFSLPGEIRNQIMQYALAPGEIDLNEVDPGQQRSETEWILTRIPPLVTEILDQFPKLAGIPTCTLEIAIAQLFATFPNSCSIVQLSAHIMDEFTPIEQCLRKTLYELTSSQTSWVGGLTSPRTSWDDITVPILKKVLEQLFKRSPISRSGLEGHPVPQLLASCKQAYLEGHELFYSLNRFYLPRGPIRHTYHYFKNLQLQNILSMKSIALRFGLEDLAREDFEDAEACVQASETLEKIMLYCGPDI